MKTGWHRIVRVLVSSSLLVLVMAIDRAPATHDPDVTDAESKCQVGASLSVSKFIAKKAKCIDNCYKKVFDNPSVLPDCVPPFGGSTAGCVTAAEGKYEGLIQSKCGPDCPECYSGGVCQTEADAKIADAEALMDALAADIYCDDSGSSDGLTRSEFKCQRAVARAAVRRFIAKKMKCLAKCRKSEHKGRAGVGSCDPPVSDMKTQDCISREELRAAALIDKKCEASVNPSAEKPECANYPTTDGAGWVALMEAEVDARDAGFYCGE